MMAWRKPIYQEYHMVTITEAARQTNTNYRTLLSWLKLANLPSTRIGAYRFVELDAVRRLVASKQKS
jgi:hypothetical protein